MVYDRQLGYSRDMIPQNRMDPEALGFKPEPQKKLFPRALLGIASWIAQLWPF